MSTSTIELIKDHVSVRDFSDKKLTTEEVNELVTAAQSASTASFLQAYSILSITDQNLLEELVDKGNLQHFILEAGHFFIFCADFRRHKDLADFENIDIQDTLEGIDAILVGAIDASLAAQNMVIAAESLGMGVCYIGGVRDGIESISEILQLPEYVFPVYGLAVGFPNNKNQQKPRFQQKAVHYFNHFPEDTLTETLQYEKRIQDYYLARSNGRDNRGWTSTIFKTLRGLPRLFMKDYLQKQGFAKK